MQKIKVIGKLIKRIKYTELKDILARRFSVLITGILCFSLLSLCLYFYTTNLHKEKDFETYCRINSINLSRHINEISFTELYLIKKHNRLGIDYLKQNKLDRAIYEFEMAKILGNSVPEIHNNLGLAFELQGRLQLAKREYQIALILYPKEKLSNSAIITHINFKRVIYKLNSKKHNPKLITFPL